MTTQMEVLSLLKFKNRGLQRFLRSSLEFAAKAPQSDFEGLDQFQNYRESVIKAIQLFDRKLVDLATAMPEELKNLAFILQVKTYLDEETRLKREILTADATVQMLLREEGERLLGEIQKGKTYFEKLEKFKADTTNPPGETLDKTL